MDSFKIASSLNGKIGIGSVRLFDPLSTSNSEQIRTAALLTGSIWEMNYYKHHAYGYCRQCNSPITIPGLSHSYCSVHGWVLTNSLLEQLPIDQSHQKASLLVSASLPIQQTSSKPKSVKPPVSSVPAKQMDLFGGAA